MLNRGLDRFLPGRRLGPGTLNRLAEAWKLRPQRLAQVHVLVNLAPDIQEKVLLSHPEASRMTFPDLLAMARAPLWSEQRRTWAKLLQERASPAESDPGGKALSGNTQG